MRSLIIDTDGGVDDAVAMMIVVSHPLTNLLAITTVNGNVSLSQATYNVCLTLGHLEMTGNAAWVPVYAGADRPLLGGSLKSANAMGEDGLGGATKAYPAPWRSAEKKHAALALVSLAKESAGRLTLLALGPLTNLALAVCLDPHFARHISRLVVMAGAVEGRGNASPAGEFNILADPEAAKIVFEAGFPELWLVSWETAMKYGVSWPEYAAQLALPGERAAFYRSITAHTASALRDTSNLPGLLLPDALAAAAAIDLGVVIEAPSLYVQIETGGSVGRGLTSVDWSGQLRQPPNAHVVLALDEGRVLELFRDALTS